MPRPKRNRKFRAIYMLTRGTVIWYPTATWPFASTSVTRMVMKDAEAVGHSRNRKRVQFAIELDDGSLVIGDSTTSFELA